MKPPQRSTEGRAGAQLVAIPPIALLAAAIGGLLLFLTVAYAVQSGGTLVKVDLTVEAWIQSNRTDAMEGIMETIGWLGSIPVVGSLVLGAGLALARKRDWSALFLLVAAVPGGVLLNTLFKVAFQRARPNEITSFAPITEFSFPSGHTSAATLLYGLLAIVMITCARRRRWRIAAGILAAGVIFAVGLSRICLHLHFLTDVVAAMALQTAWLGTILALHQRAVAHSSLLK